MSWVAIKNSLREIFRQTTAASIGLIQMIYLGFATVVAFAWFITMPASPWLNGRASWATLRVIGFPAAKSAPS